MSTLEFRLLKFCKLGYRRVYDKVSVARDALFTDAYSYSDILCLNLDDGEMCWLLGLDLVDARSVITSNDWAVFIKEG